MTQIGSLGQPLPQLRPPPSRLRTLDCDRQGLSLSNEYDETLPASYTGVQQLSLQHCVMLHHHRDNHRRVLGPLALVNSCGVGEHEFIKLAEDIDDLPAIEVDRQLACLGIDA